MATPQTAADWIDRLALEPHPEGGYFREAYRAAAQIGECCLGSDRGGSRSVSTAIYYLLSGGEFSALHRLRSDEIWHHYAGGSLTVHVIDQAGGHRAIGLGLDLDAGQTPQVMVPAGSWFGAVVDDASSFCLVGCTVAPGFDFRDFELADRAELVGLYPQHRGVLERLTRG